MTLTPEQIRVRKHYLELETQLACLKDDASDAVELASILTDSYEVPYVAWHDAAEKLPKAIQKIENRLKRVKKLWGAR